MNRHVNAIAARLSLRPPQRESLEILAEVVEAFRLEKGADLAAALRAVRARYPSVTDFEREFPSLCFALATGVGKTRLMGAFITYLHLAKGIHHFFVLAPNLTIYDKLIKDFTPNTPKYVFQGIAEFAHNPPEIVTGDNYESGRGVRRRQIALGAGFEGDVHVNIFNISKINAEVRGGKAPRIKRLSEYIGQSYFEYLSALPDLVLLMDESHRYRASAGVRVLNELNPVLGLELTATPQVESGGQSVPFRNVIYSYPLSKAMEDGFVKEPAVATRENFDPRNYNEEQLERLKLEDGIRIHEDTKVELEVYARQNDQPIVKPFVLIVAADTDHANALLSIIRSETFFEGRYRDKVITVHSNQRGEERDETVQRLMAVENPANPTEIVIHVNMLKEGWDVTNLYTIIPLRAANSKTLVEQSIGRGLRLPYGRRTGVKAVDRLTIVAHDRFQAIVDEANSPGSIIRTGVVIGRDIPLERKVMQAVQPRFMERIAPSPEAAAGGVPPEPPLFTTPVEQAAAQLTAEVIKKFEYLPSSRYLSHTDVRNEVLGEVRDLYQAPQVTLMSELSDPELAQVVEKVTEEFIRLTIDIPRIIIQPKGEITWGYNDFDLDTTGITQQPVPEDILIQHLRDHERQRLHGGNHAAGSGRLEDELVSALMDYDDISYDDQADLLYKLAGQVVTRLRSYLTDAKDVRNVLRYNRQRYAELIHTQMRDHYFERVTEYEAKVSKGFETPRASNYAALAGGGERNFRVPVENKQEIRGMVFGGFRRCLYRTQKFDVDPERRFAVICESDDAVEKWFKPAKGQPPRIHYRHDDSYVPDFIVETKTAKLICEPKRADQMGDDEVLAKARAAAKWCEHATAHELQHGGKPWSYLLIPHDAIQENRTIAGLAAGYTWKG